MKFVNYLKAAWRRSGGRFPRGCNQCIVPDCVL